MRGAYIPILYLDPDARRISALYFPLTLESTELSMAETETSSIIMRAFGLFYMWPDHAGYVNLSIIRGTPQSPAETSRRNPTINRFSRFDYDLFWICVEQLLSQLGHFGIWTLMLAEGWPIVGSS